MIFAMLKNTATNRWHPILFRPAPMPGGADLRADHMRYRSTGHHTAGFDTEEAARDHIKRTCADEGFAESTAVWSWDGMGIPAMTEWFPNPVAREKAPAP